MLTTIAICEAHWAARLGINCWLSGSSGKYQVIGEASSVVEAINLVPTQKPDILITELNLPDLLVYSVLKVLKEKEIATKVLVFSTQASLIYAKRCIDAGASGYLWKGSDPTFLLAALDTIQTGEIFVDPNIFSGIMR